MRRDGVHLAGSVTHEARQGEIQPQVARELRQALAERQAAGRIVDPAGLDKATRHASHRFSKRIRRLFDLDGG